MTGGGRCGLLSYNGVHIIGLLLNFHSKTQVIGGHETNSEKVEVEDEREVVVLGLVEFSEVPEVSSEKV